ncbi:MAG: hypothetical protein ACXWKG_14195 [Limisphaerales bacterium]
MARNTQSPKQPEQRIKCGALSVSIWRHTGANGDFFSANVQRAYTEDDGKSWKHSDSFSRDDLLVASKLLDQAHTWIQREEAKAKQASAD